MSVRSVQAASIRRLLRYWIGDWPVSVSYTHLDVYKRQLNTFLRAIGLDSLAHQWMGDQKIVLYSIIFALVWQAIGYYMVMYMASMAGIP